MFSLPMQFELGLDLGQANDYSALVLNLKGVDGADSALHHIVYAHRWRLGTSYVQIAADIAAFLPRLPVMPEKPRVIVDAGGVGRGIVDMLRDFDICPIAATLTAGTHFVIDDHGFWRIPKIQLVSTLVAVMETKRFAIAAKLPLAETIKRELLGFKLTRVTESGHQQFGNDAVTGNDDLVIAVGLAVFAAERGVARRQLFFGGLPPSSGRLVYDSLMR